MKVTTEQLENWKFTGLSNIDFVELIMSEVGVR